MKTNQAFYNPATNNIKTKSGINMTSLFTWASVFIIIVLFWSGMAVVYKKDYVPHAVAKIEHKEKKFLANHRAIQRKISGIRSFV